MDNGRSPVRFFFAGFGTCGSLTGVGRCLKERDPSIQIAAIEPPRGHRQPGLKNLTESKIPAILDRSVIDDVIRVDVDSATGKAGSSWQTRTQIRCAVCRCLRVSNSVQPVPSAQPRQQ